MTKNFSGAEIEGLVRSAQSMALHRFLKASNFVEVNLKAGEEPTIYRKDFLDAYENDLKPVIILI